MSRSVHTRPLRVRAACRVRAPFAARGHLDRRLARAARRELKVVGLRPVQDVADLERQVRLPRIVVHAPGPGRVHAVERARVEQLLLRLGASYFYGLRSIELAPALAGKATHFFGRFVAPARIVLFDVPVPPWRFPSGLELDDANRLVRAGARLEHDDRGALVVEWPAEALRDFILLDVLLHELGHHVLQHHAGKRSARIARTRDHERAAAVLAERARRWLERST